MIFLYALLLEPVNGSVVTVQHKEYRTKVQCDAAGDAAQREWSMRSEKDRAGYRLITFCLYNTPKSLGAHMKNPPTSN
jgi:hypothetical protein